MQDTYLNLGMVTKLWTKIKNKFAEKNHTHENYLTEHPTVTTKSPTNTDTNLAWGGKVTAYSEIIKDDNGHVTGGTIKTFNLPSSEATTTEKGLMSANDKTTLDSIPNIYAKKSDIVNVYRYQGSVASFSALPNTEQEQGFVWNVEDTGKNYAWTGTEWDDLGGSFETLDIRPITEEELDAICV